MHSRRSGRWWAVVLLVAGLAISPSRASATGFWPSRDWVREKLRELASTRTGSWVQSLWETKQGSERTLKARCFWAGPDNLRLDIEEGFGKGAHLFVRGDDLTIRPPGPLGILKLHRSVADPRFRSLRGRDLRQTSFLDELQFILAHWDNVEMTPGQSGPVLHYHNGANEPVRASFQLDPLRMIQFEVSEDGRVVERVTYEQLQLDTPMDPGLFKP